MFSKKKLARQVGLTSKAKMKRTEGSAGDHRGAKPQFYTTSCPNCGHDNKVSRAQTAFKCANCRKEIVKPLRSGNF